MRTESTSPPRYAEHVVPFVAGDGRPLNLVHILGERAPDKGPVVLVHGAGVRANIFRAPVEQSLVDTLVTAGYDVWLENWRASIDLEPNAWTLDQAAVHDHPKAIQTIVRETGWDEVKAIVHCQGSTSFMLSAVAGLVPQVKVIVSNAVSLHPQVPRSAGWKARYALPVVARLTDHLNPQWGLEAKGAVARAITLLVKATHRECDNTVCRLASFTYGTGFPTLWRHENLNPETHEWLKHEFAQVPLTFFQQMAQCLRAGQLVPVEGYRELPEDVAERPPETDARFVLLTGALNRCFLPESQRRTHEQLSRHRPGYHALHVIPGYGHLDIFMGQNAARDVFPLIQAELDRPV
ncbi:alpha/beta fold hydrolase [Stigmatella aurantiaca]|uniref:alpha/beta fold hydrolase n=1 Tax=Stigmatella aurantiaca TaxID=41 RepID=UPI0009428125|nr:alpha/beta fold hydrolase [Stigmatella aurantiaca]